MESYRDAMEECPESTLSNFSKCFLAFLILIRVAAEAKKINKMLVFLTKMYQKSKADASYSIQLLTEVSGIFDYNSTWWTKY